MTPSSSWEDVYSGLSSTEHSGLIPGTTTIHQMTLTPDDIASFGGEIPEEEYDSEESLDLDGNVDFEDVNFDYIDPLRRLTRIVNHHIKNDGAYSNVSPLDFIIVDTTLLFNRERFYGIPHEYKPLFEVFFVRINSVGKNNAVPFQYFVPSHDVPNDGKPYPLKLLLEDFKSITEQPRQHRRLRTPIIIYSDLQPILSNLKPPHTDVSSAQFKRLFMIEYFKPIFSNLKLPSLLRTLLNQVGHQYIRDESIQQGTMAMMCF